MTNCLQAYNAWHHCPLRQRAMKISHVCGVDAIIDVVLWKISQVPGEVPVVIQQRTDTAFIVSPK